MKAQVFILSGRDVGRSFTVEEASRLGRSSECEISLRDRSISRFHAKLECVDGAWFLEDLNSRNGVRRDGRGLKRVEVMDRDEFLLGQLPIRIRIGAEVRVAQPEPVGGAVEFEEEIEFESLEEEAVDLPEIEIEELRSPEEEAVDLPEIEIEELRSPEEEERGGYERRRRELLDSGRRRGFLRGDLAQQPWWIRTIAVVFVLGLFAVLAFFAFKAVEMLRS
ncbi:MAG: hypothetical protein CMJ89_10910 [Planctomycetes bacterium]|nr:hypothetical protein [Planctomycetota bacterium]